MSSIGNKIRAGFFATPERQGEYLRELLSFEADTAVFDPTCGEGEILKQLTDDRGLSIQTYGVELDKRRAEKAKQNLDIVVESSIESMVISHDVFGMVYLNPPYDMTMLGMGDEKTDRKEYTELVRNTRYLMPGGLMVYVIPSYRFADKKISRFLSTNFEDIAMTRFSEEDYDDFRQCIFIGRRKSGTLKEMNQKLFDFLQQLEDEDFVVKKVTSLPQLVGRKKWAIPSGNLDVPTFYTRIEKKSEFIEAIRTNRGFQAFIEQTRPKQLVVGGDPIINISQGQMALLLASGAVNGVIGDGKTLHAVQGMEIVSHTVTEEKTEHMTVTKKRTKRDVSVKIITPSGKVKKLM